MAPPTSENAYRAAFAIMRETGFWNDINPLSESFSRKIASLIDAKIMNVPDAIDSARKAMAEEMVLLTYLYPVDGSKPDRAAESGRAQIFMGLTQPEDEFRRIKETKSITPEYVADIAARRPLADILRMIEARTDLCAKEILNQRGKSAGREI